MSVSQNAIVHDKPQAKSSEGTPGTESSTSEPKGQELVYAARISLDRTLMQVDDNLVNLTPGMAVTVEIKTGSRTVMSYLLCRCYDINTTACANAELRCRLATSLPASFWPSDMTNGETVQPTLLKHGSTPWPFS